LIKTIRLFNKDIHNGALTFDVQPINIFVGPNNAGKSLFLQELFSYLKKGQTQYTSFKIIEDIKAKDYSSKEVEAFLANYTYPDHYNPEQYISFKPSFTSLQRVNKDEIMQSLSSAETTEKDFLNKYRFPHIEGPQTLFINGENRLDSFKDSKWSTSKDEASNYKDRMVDILRDFPEKMDRLKSVIFNSFSKHLGVMYDGGLARFVLSDTEIPQKYEMNLAPEAVEFYRNCDQGFRVSDGRKAYIGIVSKVISTGASTILIDEPEAFLHPPLARKLGANLSDLAIREKKEIYISTHSADFIMGCIESNVPVNIIRLEYENRNGTANFIENSTLTKLMRNPLLRSVNVIDGLFYKNVIVTEADSDRAFYQEINTRLKEHKPEWHIEDCLFLNAQNKQTVGPIVNLLRSIGVPTASLIDFDFIKDGGGVFRGYLSFVNIPPSLQSSISDKKTIIKDFFPIKPNGNFASNSEIKTQGVLYLQKNSPNDLFPTALSMLKEVNEYGLFPVPNGELESWLSEIEATQHGNTWLIEKFEKMGDNPFLDTYVKPFEGDVWLFMNEIKQWLSDPERKGMAYLF
jgi:ABC-type multidrug transport system ATPase subunit